MCSQGLLPESLQSAPRMVSPLTPVPLQPRSGSLDAKNLDCTVSATLKAMKDTGAAAESSTEAASVSVPLPPISSRKRAKPNIVKDDFISTAHGSGDTVAADPRTPNSIKSAARPKQEWLQGVEAPATPPVVEAPAHSSRVHTAAEDVKVRSRGRIKSEKA